MFVTSLVQAKLCLLQTIPHCKCKGEQNYGEVTLFVRTDICSVQDQKTVSAANSDSYTESNISYVTCYTSCACDVNKHGVTSNKKHPAIQKQCFLLAIKPSFLKLPCEQSNHFNYNDMSNNLFRLLP